MPRDNEEDVLLSGLQVLLTLSVEELLDVQHDVNTQLRKRLHHSRNAMGQSSIEPKIGHERLLKETSLIHKEFHSNKIPIGEPIEKDVAGTIDLVNDNEHIENSESDLSDDTEDLILTQLESSKTFRQGGIRNSRHSKIKGNQNDISKFAPTDSKLDLSNTQEPDQSNYYDGNNKIYSSPLKDSLDSFRDPDKTEIPLIKIDENAQLIETDPISSKKRVHVYSEHDQHNCYKKDSNSKQVKVEYPYTLPGTCPSKINYLTYRKESNPLTKPVRIKKKIDFNLNPLTSKPWILEDFKPNRDVSAVKQGKKRLEEFYKKVGKPAGLQIDNNTAENILLDSFDMSFDNLRQRTDSPPGYGRLDFPTTQEREEDKIASKKIIYKKTLQRYLSSVNYRIPPQEREFLFKREAFNEAVNNSNFEWDPTTLKIYPTA
ncbi:similar to Saccharomyces cerevisiae YGL175C SAE2 Endonuclease that processes hairpin DNA structures with the MRX complex [Maudiozyma saulgeensis]|uniref:Similar to Saccharomyces cerevisiae YGL175C SAE2 Endonuclease that processes hairpin DNA structures with the MRX complex n=1 Tax=Maudiozyma saulgeensis TaxID=1789683 RepID=A0A1X7QYK7_9SACH|nr:similar to Saccharomyces cerevisiae YGL175C SAE2 Endonuclease that processes hairpin DNA structures with the MRX complex [Kazachstania saulgeensis]